MRLVTRPKLLLALTCLACGHAMADSNSTLSRKHALQPVSVATDSDADLLAERHLALYRASRLQTPHSEADGGDGIPQPVRSSATAAIPLAPRAPVLPESSAP